MAIVSKSVPVTEGFRRADPEQLWHLRSIAMNCHYCFGFSLFGWYVGDFMRKISCLRFLITENDTVFYVKLTWLYQIKKKGVTDIFMKQSHFLKSTENTSYFFGIDKVWYTLLGNMLAQTNQSENFWDVLLFHLFSPCLSNSAFHTCHFCAHILGLCK